MICQAYMKWTVATFLLGYFLKKEGEKRGRQEGKKGAEKGWERVEDHRGALGGNPQGVGKSISRHN